MAGRINSLIEQLVHRRMLRRWGRMNAHAGSADLLDLRDMRTRAREVRRRLDQVLHTADARLTLPLIGSNAIQKPLHSDWSYRPELWRGPLSPAGMVAVHARSRIGDEVTLFHDCDISELTVRQIRNTRETDLAPFGLRMDVFKFGGSFLSLVIKLPESGVTGLKRRHLLRLTCVIEMEQPLEMFARLNIKHGPNGEQLVRELLPRNGESVVDFDLAYTNLNEKRVERAWIDLIFEGPEMNQIIVRDINLTRRPRAEV